CSKQKEQKHRSINIDGSYGIKCIVCKDRQNKKIEDFKLYLNNIKLNIMIKNGSCCERCNIIFIKNDDNPYQVFKIKTQLNDDGIRVLLYDDCWYDAVEFMNYMSDFIELRISQFDH